MEQLDGAMEKKSAIGAIVNSEGIKDKIRDILVMESQNGIPTLCEMCRTAIKRHSVDEVAVLCWDRSLIEIKKFKIS